MGGQLHASTDSFSQPETISNVFCKTDNQSQLECLVNVTYYDPSEPETQPKKIEMKLTPSMLTQLGFLSSSLGNKPPEEPKSDRAASISKKFYVEQPGTPKLSEAYEILMQLTKEENQLYQELSELMSEETTIQSSKTSHHENANQSKTAEHTGPSNANKMKSRT